MKYRWLFDEAGVLTECKPKLNDDTQLEFAPESGEMFYRAKLTTALTFQFEFDEILSKGFAHTHIVVLQRYDDDESDFVEVWRGKFTLTDCTINYDRNTIEVSPATIDRYTDIMAAMETDYNIVKLAPQMQQVNILIRPLLQLYEINDNKISNYVGNNYFEKICEPIGRNDIEQYKFGFQKQYISAEIKFTENWGSSHYRKGKTITYVGELIYGGFPQEETRVYGQYWDGSQYQTDVMRVRIAQMTNKTIFYFFGFPDSPGQDQIALVTAEFEAYGMGTTPIDISTYTESVEDSHVQWDMLTGRLLLQTDLNSITIGDNTYTIDEIPLNDMSGSNYNYNKTMWADIIEIKFSAEYSATPTIWGQSYDERYFIKPTDTPAMRWVPVGQSLWKYFSIWYRVNNAALLDAINEKLTAKKTIKDGYLLTFTIAKLLQKSGWNGQYIISGVFGSQDYVGANLLPVITPKSNVISSYYDTPAQSAPISLSKIFSMLKQAYKIYWHIDENNNLHIEHISYYQNGHSYTESPQLLVDLESDLHTRTKHPKDYGQNIVKFDKSGMPGVISFGWMDKQTVPFDGFDIKALDAYIEQGTKEENLVGDFSTDVDFVLSSPNDISKDGFFLFALPKIGGSYSKTLQIEKINITDENGDNYDVTIQNADAAFCKIHKTFWRYDMPCENVNINNEKTTAITTGRFKVQNVEFADTVMAEILKDIDNCNKLIRTQQGDGHIKTLSINLNSLVAKGDLVFNFVGRWYYLKGTALGASISIFVNGESTTIEVSNNKFTYRYKEPISTLTFGAADVVFVDFADCDLLDNLTSCDSMFDGCAELLAVDFGNKTFGAVTSANNMFRGCVALTTLICPDSSTWKSDLDFSDCPALTLESFYDLIKFLYYYNAGVHTITPNPTMWDALNSDIQDDLIAKATERGWTINIPARYSVAGESTSSTVYAIINGTNVEIPVTGGVWQYNYNAPITSISFENDSNLTMVDFSLSDGLAGLTTLAGAFKNCSALTMVDLSNCDLSNVASATNTFAGCTSLTELIVTAGTWKPDVDLSDTAMVYSDMLSTIGILYTYATGTHTIIFNQTIWDAMSVAEQQIVFDAAGAKGWTTNAVAVVFQIKGTSTNINGMETLLVSFIDDNLNVSTESIVVSVDGNGNFIAQYADDKKIYSLDNFIQNSTTITSIDFSESDGLTELVSATDAFAGCVNLSTLNIGMFTWLVDVTLSNCPIVSASMLAFLNNFADHSTGSQHIVRISPFTAVDMGANADTIKASLAAKNWRLPLSQIGKYTRLQLLTMVTNGYVPVSGLIEHASINANDTILMGEDSEFYGSYYCTSTNNYVIVHGWVGDQQLSNVTGTRQIDGVYDGNDLLVTMTQYPTIFSYQVNATGILKNLVYVGKLLSSNTFSSFVHNNYGIIEDCVLEMFCPCGPTGQAALVSYNYEILRRTIIRTIPITGHGSQYLLMYSNRGIMQDICIIGVFDFIRSAMYLNSGTCERVIINSMPFYANYNSNQQLGIITGGTVIDCYKNADRFVTNGAGTAKTSVELKQDAIGSGIYANYSSDVWDKDNDGYPILKKAKNYQWTTDLSMVADYTKLISIAITLETATSQIELVISNAAWGGMTAEEQYIIKSTLAAKNYSIGQTVPAFNPTYTISGVSTKPNNVAIFFISWIDDNTQAISVQDAVYCPTDSNGNFVWGYSGKKLCGVMNLLLLNRNTLTSIVFSEPMQKVTTTNGMFNGCTILASVDMGNATLESVINSANMFNNCTALASLNVPQNSTAIAQGATNTDTPMALNKTNIGYADMLKVANWLRDFTNETAHTITYRQAVWITLTTDEQNAIDTILQSKNWTRALAN